MSQENVELARRGFEAFARGGRDAVVELLDPEIELWLPSGLIQAGGTYRGHEAVLGWMKEWAEAWEEIEYKPEEFIPKGRFWYVFKYRNAILRRWELYPDRAQALEAAGLSE